MRLIAYAQNNIAVEEISLKMDLEVKLPHFDSGMPKAPEPVKPATEPDVRAEEMAKMLPNLDDLDINQMSTISSLIPSIDAKAKE